MLRSLTTLALMAMLTLSAFAQEAPATGPAPKSQEEADAISAVQSATEPAARLEAAQTLLADYPDTDYQEFANYMSMLSAMELNDYDNMMIFGERTLDVNGDNVGVLLQLAGVIPLRTREFDLDKEEKLGKAEDYAKRAFALVPNMPNPDPNMTAEQWLMVKKDFMAQANEALGMVAVKRNNNEEAVDYLMKALNLASEQSGQTFYYLAAAYQKQGKKDEALNAIEKAAAPGDFPVDVIEALKGKITAM